LPQFTNETNQQGLLQYALLTVNKVQNIQDHRHGQYVTPIHLPSFHWYPITLLGDRGLGVKPVSMPV